MSQPLHINKVCFEIESCDQGWSSYPEEHGIKSSHTWGDTVVEAKYTKFNDAGASVGASSSAGSGEKEDKTHTDASASTSTSTSTDLNLVVRPTYRVYRNYHAKKDFSSHNYDFEDNTAFVRQINTLLGEGRAQQVKVLNDNDRSKTIKKTGGIKANKNDNAETLEQAESAAEAVEGEEGEEGGEPVEQQLREVSIQLYSRSQYPGWRNKIKSSHVWCEFLFDNLEYLVRTDPRICRDRDREGQRVV